MELSEGRPEDGSMTFLLMILKIIGIALLVIFGILVVGVFMILLIPLRYRVRAEQRDETVLTVRVSWLLHLVRLIGYLEEGAFVSELRILFFRKRFEDDVDAMEELSEDDIPAANLNSHESEKDLVVIDLNEDSEDMDTEYNSAGVESAEDPLVDDRKTKSSNSKLSPGDIYHKIKGMFQDISGNIRYRKKKARYWKKMFEDQHNKNAVAHLKKELFLLLRWICPTKMKVNADFSAGTPDLTGQVTGILALFPMAYRNRWIIYPDFAAENAYIRGSADVRGRLYLYHIAGMLLRIYFDRECRRLFRLLRK